MYERKEASNISSIFHRRLQHGDIKPTNVMFREHTDDVVLCDLGVSRISSGATTTAYEGHGGTQIYFAPELFENDTRSATHASDM